MSSIQLFDMLVVHEVISPNSRLFYYVIYFAICATLKTIENWRIYINNYFSFCCIFPTDISVPMTILLNKSVFTFQTEHLSQDGV